MIHTDIKNLDYLHIDKYWNEYSSIFFEYKGLSVHILNEVPFEKLKIYLLITLQAIEESLKNGITNDYLHLPFSVYFEPIKKTIFEPTQGKLF